MTTDEYRSYVIRVRRHPARGVGTPAATRLDIEDLLAGGTATVAGETAATFADSLERLVESSRVRPLQAHEETQS